MAGFFANNSLEVDCLRGGIHTYIHTYITLPIREKNKDMPAHVPPTPTLTEARAQYRRSMRGFFVYLLLNFIIC